MSKPANLASLLTLLTGLLLPPPGVTAAEDSSSGLVWQTVQQYFSHNPPGQPPIFIEGTRRVNSFVQYTHLGTDFGFHGPAAYDISWRENVVRANLRQQPDAWAGMWHCLAGLAREPNRWLDFSAPFAPWIENPHQPRIEAIQVIAAGYGTLKLEIQDMERAFLWSDSVKLADSTFQPTVFQLDPAQLRKAKFLNWTAEPNSDISLNRLALGFHIANTDLAFYTCLASYAKISRCHEGGLGLVRDRAHTEPGAFDTVPTSGLFALATAAAAAPPLSIVSRENALKLVRDIHRQVSSLQAPLGLLPHFIRHIDGRYQIHPGTEYSTIDTAIYYQSMLLAAGMLNDTDLKADLLSRMRKIAFDQLLLPDGTITHGLLSDGITLLPHGWADWGGETALIILQRQLSHPSAAPLRLTIDHPGRPWQGTGFIAELQSLFYPDFDAEQPDTLSATNWRLARTRHLQEQQGYISRHWRGTLSHELGLYGLSAGENETGNAYRVNGTALPGVNLIHPHYFLMSARLHERPEEILSLIGDLRRVGFFPPYGLVENVTVTGSSYLPMNGSLNAGFEALAAFHLLCHLRHQPDPIYQAALASPEIRAAMRSLYSAPLSSGE